jgi:methyl-accepting chemotaxis protein
MRIRDLSVRVKLLSLLVVYTLGFLAFTAVLSETSRMERASHASISTMKDLVADVLPPPKYIIEPYLTLLQMSYETDPAAREALAKAWAELKKAFEERQTFWEDGLPESGLKRALVRDSTQTAREFFSIGDKEFIPAAHAGDRARMQALLLGSLREVYAKHRASIDEVVTAANKQSDAYARDTAATIEARHVQMFAIGLGIILACAGFGWSVSRSITRRVRATVSALDAVAAGDLTHRLHDDSGDDLGKMSRALNAAVDGMSGALGQVQQLSNTLTDAAGDLAASAEALAGGAHEQAASLEQTAASLEEITATVRQSSDNAQQASQLAAGSRQSAERGGGVIGQANTAMTEIHDASDRISNIITTIDEIAFQTNILALNAAVEAARAGEQGRGFAVVAAQVGTLAQRSSDAAKEIKGLIQDSVRKVAGGSALVSRSGQSLQEIVKSVTSVTDLVDEMAAAFREQSTGLDQITSAVTQMDDVMRSNSSQTEALSTTASRLTAQADHLRSLLARFRLSAGASIPDAPANPASRTSAAPAPRSARQVPRAAQRPFAPPRKPVAAKELPATPPPATRFEPARDVAREPAPRPPTPDAAGTEFSAMDEAMTAAAASNGLHDDDRGFEEV